MWQRSGNSSEPSNGRVDRSHQFRPRPWGDRETTSRWRGLRGGLRGIHRGQLADRRHARRIDPAIEPGCRSHGRGSDLFGTARPAIPMAVGRRPRTEFSPEATSRSTESIRDAIRRSPFQFRWWGELGRSYEQAGQTEDAEASFRKAVSLAPNYTIPNWQLGNFYLRQGRIDEAIDPLRVAARYSNLYRGQVFAISWSYFGGDAEMVERFAAGDPLSIASLASFYAGVGRPDDALRTWNRLNDADKEANRTGAAEIARRLFDQRRFLVASEFARQAGLDKFARPGAFTNGDFESAIREPNTFLFDWTATRTDSKADVGLDSSVSHGGRRSLRVLFRGYTKLQFFDVQQLIAVRPGSRQRIEFWVRTENLRSGSMPLFSVLGGPREQTLAVSGPLPSGTNDWQKISIDVDVPADSEGIRIVSGREPCPTECPLAGIFWVDDFQISEIGR